MILLLSTALLSSWARIWQVSDRQVVVDYAIAEAPASVEVSFFTNGVEVADAQCWTNDCARRQIERAGSYRTVWLADKFEDDDHTWDVSARATVRVKHPDGSHFTLNTEEIALGGKAVYLGGRREPGFRGIWYFNEPSHDEYVYKYSGGLGTYCESHVPMAIYSKEAQKTFFCWGGTPDPSSTTLLHCLSYFDHRRKCLGPPIAILDKRTTDAHDNPVIALDGKGFIWMFSSSHGRLRKSYISRSVRPYDISAFRCVKETNFSYPQPHFIHGKGFLFIHTWYSGGRHVGFSCLAEDGSETTPRTPLLFIDRGDYIRSWRQGNKVGIAFDRHPITSGTQPLNRRTDIYYMETSDMGRTWKTINGIPLSLPITNAANPALVKKYGIEGDDWRNVYIKCLRFTPSGNPLILYVLSKGHKTGPDAGPREWRVATWREDRWNLLDTEIRSDSNYDFGFINPLSENEWILLGATGSGPQPFNPGGEIVAWKTVDGGRSWTLEKKLTSGSVRNHNYPRQPIGANHDFFAFWADGDGRKPSPSHLFYCDGNFNVFEMPYTTPQY